MKLYNTRSRMIEEFVPNNKDVVTLYTCGPTVYHFAHIGNLRTYIMEDVLEKALNFVGYNVKRVMNITDVGHLTSDGDTGEDKMLKGAKREHKSVMDIAKYYTDCFKEDCNKLNIKWPETVIPATSMIDYYINFIEELIKKGYAYFANGNVYFDTSKLKDYYVLSNHVLDDLMEGVREGVSIDSNKKNKNDFVLWFTKSKFDSQELKWDSPWGLGYPGWHIECSCISIKYLGEYLDIHCGGVDNIFPHHTNEIAQTESYLGHKWGDYWFHTEHLNDSTGKMSKSKGEFLTVSLLKEKGYNPLSYRFLCLQSHYRKQMIFTFESLDTAENAYKKLLNRVANLKNDGVVDKNIKEMYITKFKETLEDDLNTSNSLTVLYEVLKSDINDATKRELVLEFDKVLSLDLMKSNTNDVDSNKKKYIQEMIEKRELAKREKNYVLADEIRNKLNEEGIVLKDTREGTIYEIIK
ncbi:MAG: cysteine--tRNA ligase [Bacilli bacterium]|nr:cysteine--tRNA ligase [Bacilli bacterium]